MFPMEAVALGSICWPEVVLCNWFQWYPQCVFGIGLVCVDLLFLISCCLAFFLFCLVFSCLVVLRNKKEGYGT